VRNSLHIVITVAEKYYGVAEKKKKRVREAEKET